MALKVTLNGREQVFEALSECASLESLIGAMGLRADRVAVERNGQIVARPDWTATILAEDDRLEVVHFVGGGA